MEKKDVVVIGGGPAGYNFALKASELGFNVHLFEKNALGGTCLNNGCIPTKCLLKDSSKYSDFVSDYKLESDFDFTKALDRKSKVITKLNRGIAFLLKKPNITVHLGETPHFINNTTLVADDFTIENAIYVLATGTTCAPLNIEGGHFSINSDHVLHNPIAENDITIIGGGVVGIELATYLNNLGKTVRVLEYADNILTGIDPDCVKVMNATLKKKKVKVFTSVKVEKIEQVDGKKIVTATQNDKAISFETDVVISCVGRKTSLENLGLENTDLAYDRKIAVDVNNKTNLDNIYAIGDISSKIMLAHFAEAQGINLAYHLAEKSAERDLSIVPSAIYTHPEIACVGLTDVGDDTNYIIGLSTMAGNGKANVEGCLDGFVKTVFDKNGIIVGGAIVNSRATDMISELSLAIANKLHINDIAKVIHPHPTLSESITFSVENAKSKF